MLNLLIFLDFRVLNPFYICDFTGAWLNILEPLEKMRRDNDLVKNFPSYLSGEDLFGLTEPSILKLIESVGPS